MNYKELDLMSTLFSTYKESLYLDNIPNLEIYKYIDDLLSIDEVKSLDNFNQHYDISRLQHVLSVANVAFYISERHGLDSKAVARGAVLHDLFYYDWHAKDDNTHRLHGYRHPGFALSNAKKLTELSEKEENIILRHMWPLTPTPPKYKEAYIVSLSDKYCATMEIMYSITKKYNLKIPKFNYDLA